MIGGQTIEAKRETLLNLRSSRIYQRTGFPTEIVAGSIMASWDYGVIHNPAYPMM